jgi:hypothetical protein
VLVFVHTISATQTVTGVTYGGVAMTKITGGVATDTGGEPGRVDTYFLGSSVPTGAQTIVVSRTNNGTEMYASASTQTASTNTEVYSTGIVLLQNNGTYAVQSVTDGSTGVNSVRYASGYYGGNGTLSAGTGSTLLNSIDYGSQTSTTARETTAGQGARNVGFTQATSDDRAAVHLAAREAVTTIADDGAPSSVTIAPGASITDLDYFTLTSSSDGDTVTAATVTLSPAGAFNNIAQVDLTDNSNVARCTAVTNPASNTVTFSTCTSNGGVTVTTSATTYKVRITPKTHANMPAVPGASYATTGTVTAFTSSNPHAGTDSSSATITTDNLSPNGATSVSGSAIDSRTTLNWTTSNSADFNTTSGSVLYRWTGGSAGSEVPSEGSTAVTGATNGTATTACVISSAASTGLSRNDGTGGSSGCTTTALTNGQAYTYKIFQQDTRGNYDAGVTIGTFTPNAAPTLSITQPASGNTNMGYSSTYDITYSLSDTDNIVTSAFYYDTNNDGVGGTAITGACATAAEGTGVSCTFSTSVFSIGTPYYIYGLTSDSINGTVTAVSAGTITRVDTRIVATSGANGSVTPSGTTAVNYGGSQTYTITPSVGYNIATLTVDGGSVATSTSYTFSNVTASHTISATFSIQQFNIVASSGANGSVTPSGTTAVNYGGSQLYTITPDAGYNIATLTVDGGSVATSTTYTFSNVTAAHTIHATFAINSFTITATHGANGNVTPDGVTPVSHGSSQLYNITPNTGYHIDVLTIDGIATTSASTYTFSNVTANHTINATFAIDTFTITITQTAGGTISGPTTVNYGDTPSYTITPDSTFHIESVTVDSSPVATSSPYVFTAVSANHSITATYATTTFAITASSGANGSVTPSGVTNVPQGGNQTYAITPDTGFHVNTLTIDGSPVTASTTYTFTNVQATHTISATFATSTFTITATSGSNGSVTPSGTTAVNYNDSQTYTITPDTDFTVASVTVDGSSVTATTSYTFTNVTANHTINATFIASSTPSFTITPTAGAGGSITPSLPTTVFQGDSQTFSITASPGYSFLNLNIDGVATTTTASYTFTNVQANHTIDASFIVASTPTFTITSTNNPHGSITPLGATTVAQGSDQTFTITPASGYYVDTLLVDATSTATTTSYTFGNVQANHTIEATFAAIPAEALVAGPILASITFDGKAFPGGKISVFQKDLNVELTTSQQDVSNFTGSFHLRFTDLPKNVHSFGLLAKDIDGRTSQSKFFLVDANNTNPVYENIVVPPTVDLRNTEVSRGGNVTVFGYASPSHTVRIYINGILTKEGLAGNNGSYSFNIPTSALNFGQYQVTAKQINLDGGIESDFSTTKTFTVSKLVMVKTDLNSDGKIDVRDLSIFLSLWNNTTAEGRNSIDFSGDKKVDLTDFSIFINSLKNQ